MNRQEEQLKSAEDVVKASVHFAEFVNAPEMAKAHMDKYYPKDELFEKWNKLEWPLGNGAMGKTVTFDRAKKAGLFTMALDEAIEFYQKWEIDNPGGKIPVYGLINYLFGIRSKYTPEAE